MTEYPAAGRASQPKSLTAQRAARCMPYLQRVTMTRRAIRGDRIARVWPSERLTIEEARYILALAKDVEADILARLILGEADPSLGRLLRDTARRTLRRGRVSSLKAQLMRWIGAGDTRDRI